MCSLIRRIYLKLRWFLGKHEKTLFAVLLRRDLSKQLVTRKSDIIIEGFPRSGNTFTETAIQLAQGDQPLRIASHLHFPAHVIRGVRLGKPCLIVLREPLDAIASMLVYYNDNFPTRQAIREYIEFYEMLPPLQDQILVATFKEVRDDMGFVIKRFNTKFNLHLAEFEHTPKNERRCFKMIEQKAIDKYGETHIHSMRSAKPTHTRDDLKKQMIERLSSKTYAMDMQRAQAVYQTLYDAHKVEQRQHTHRNAPTVTN